MLTERGLTILDWPPEFIGQSPSTNLSWSILRTVQSQSQVDYLNINSSLIHILCKWDVKLVTDVAQLLNFPDCSTSLLLFLRRSEDKDLYYFSFSISNHVHEFCSHSPLQRRFLTSPITNHEPFCIPLSNQLWFFDLRVTIISVWPVCHHTGHASIPVSFL